VLHEWFDGASMSRAVAFALGLEAESR